ncbi:NAD(P)-binding protein [Viridothelium virens]|uniref:NAD(P)-binding protein n=1 Tax=Viridothelium virens TaxID=1048519 RepID=A0A6A6HD18_VIRVR|nr:NAD(P)-binding protein [Viridothelium virens]
MSSYVVTGASRGLGYAFIVHLASIPGNTVIGLVRNAESTRSRLVADGVNNITILQADITDRTALKKAADETTKITGGKLDYLINNAAFLSHISAFKTLGDFNDDPETLEADLLDSFRSNVVGVTHTINAFIPLLQSGTAKKVANISTGMADIDLINDFHIPIGAPYSISKAALNALTAKYNALYAAPSLPLSSRILFLSISPGVVATDESGVPPTPEQIEGGKAMAAQFKEYAPDFSGPISPQTSVEMVMRVLEEKSVEKGDGGRFVSHKGDQRWL